MRVLNLCLLLMFSGCNTISSQQLDMSAFDQISIEQIKELAASEFAATCLATKGNIATLRERVSGNGWTSADKNALSANKLSKLQKKILQIPGGGGRFSETQTIYKKSVGGNMLFLNLEESFSRSGSSSSKCEIYADDELLKNCSALGKALKRAPDRNQKYEKQKAHFIVWSLSIDESPGEIICKQAPNSRLLGYSGISLSLLKANKA